MSTIDPPEKKKPGCFFYGCITLLIFVFVMAIAAFFGVRYAAAKVNGLILEYSDSQPMALPKVEMPSKDLHALEDRVAAFNRAAMARSNTPPLVLNSDEINALLSMTTNFAGFKDRFYFKIEGSEIKGQLSLPMETEFRVPLLHFKGRYLNGTGTFRVMLTNDMLSVYLDSLEVKGKPFPERLMSKVRGSDLAGDFNNNRTNADILSHYESMEVKDGKMILKAKGP
jgi:hypothetical protein